MCYSLENRASFENPPLSEGNTSSPHSLFLVVGSSRPVDGGGGECAKAKFVSRVGVHARDAAEDSRVRLER